MTASGERRLIHRGKKFDLEMVRVAMPSGRTVEREVVRHPGAVCIVPVLEPGPVPAPRLVMIRNRRFALGVELLEFPAGTLEPGEDPVQCAARELIEETGYRAERIQPLGTFFTTPGMTDERMHAYAASGLAPVGQDLEEDEQIRVEVVDASWALAAVDRGDLMDAKSIVSLFLALRRGVLRIPGALGS
jgi:ADP-ribose pyrophosphatase